MTHLHNIQRDVAFTNEENGWRERWHKIKATDPDASIDHVLAKLALIDSEVAEAVEDVRERGIHALTQPLTAGAENEAGLIKPEGVASELADVVIRVLDLADMLGIRLEDVVVAKLAYNATRGRFHGGKAV